MVKTFYEKEFKLTWLKPSASTTAMPSSCRPETAQTMNLKTLRRPGQGRGADSLGAGPEFGDRRDGIKGLKEVYGIEFGEFRQFAALLAALRRADAEADRRRQRLCHRLADRSREVRPAQGRQGPVPAVFLAPVVRMDTVANNPKAVEALLRVGALIDNPTMQELNRQVEVDGRKPRAVAAAFLRGKRGDPLTPHRVVEVGKRPIDIADVVAVAPRRCPCPDRAGSGGASRTRAPHRRALRRRRSARVYGLNTGLGAAVDTGAHQGRGPRAFQQQAVMARAVGVGDFLATDEVRATLFVRLVGITHGASGLSPALAAVIRDMLDKGVHPRARRIGCLGRGRSEPVGAALPAAGRSRRRRSSAAASMPGCEALGEAGIEPPVLEA